MTTRGFHWRWLALGVMGLAASVGLGVWLQSGSVAKLSPYGIVEIHIGDHREAIGDFDELMVSVSAIAVHAVGTERDRGWVDIAVQQRQFDLTRYVGGSDALVSQSKVVAGRYDAVRLNIAQAEGKLKNGTPVGVMIFDGPVALAYSIQEGRLTVIRLEAVLKAF